jgi:UDP-N-acetylglucosamine transferase subunit ALG13
MDFISFYSILLGLAFYKLNSLLKKKEKTSRRKRWLFEEIIHQYGGFAGIIIFPFHIFVQIFNHADDFLEMTITYWA